MSSDSYSSGEDSSEPYTIDESNTDDSSSEEEVILDSKGRTIERIYRKNGLIHREYGPAVIKYAKKLHTKNEELYICSEQYYFKGKLHRTRGAAIIFFREPGGVSKKVYMRHGEIYIKGDKPAVIYYNKRGFPTKEEFFKAGRICMKKNIS